MSFADIHGNEKLISRLKQTILTDRIFHGYIFEGPASDTEEIASAFIKAALCESHSGDACGMCVPCKKFDAGNSEDVLVLGTEGTIKDKDVELLIAQTMKKSFTGNRTFMMIKNADSMTLRAQNRLLKTLEEPPGGVCIILLTENAESFVQTIRSRCQLIKLFSEGMEGVRAQDEEFHRRAVDLAVAIMRGKPAYALWKEIDFFTASRQTAETFVGIAETFFRDIVIYRYDEPGRLILNVESISMVRDCARRVPAGAALYAIECAERAQTDMARNVSAGHAIKYMIFDIKEKLSEKVS